MEILLDSNPLCTEKQNLNFEKFVLLIGENGSGKSLILNSIFKSRLDQIDLLNNRLVCFSSGHNERYSREYSRYLKMTRRSRDDSNLSCFYYDKTWSNLLIFLASTLKGGRVRTLLRSLNYVIESKDQALDSSTILGFNFGCEKKVAERAIKHLTAEDAGDEEYSLSFYKTLKGFIDFYSKEDYDLSLGFKRIFIRIDGSFITNFINHMKTNEIYGSRNFNIESVASFFTQASDIDLLITRHSFNLYLSRDLSLDKISDGQFQLLFLYAMLDLFDGENTIFLFDEADSHLHYKNIGFLMKAIKEAQGNTIMTTHLIDSIAAIGVENIRVVTNGKIFLFTENEELKTRMEELSFVQSTDFKILSFFKNIILIDNKNDWVILKYLIERKFGNDKKEEIDKNFSEFTCKSCPSNWDSHTTSFAKSKINWLNEFVSYLKTIKNSKITKNIFLICDRDDLPLNSIDQKSLKLKDGVINKDIIALEKDADVKIHILVWRRREIKHYLLSYSALHHYGALGKINNDSLAKSSHLYIKNNGDYNISIDDNGVATSFFNMHFESDLSNDFNEGIGLMSSKKVKSLLSEFIENDNGLCVEKSKIFIDFINPEEISSDIEFVYNALIEHGQ